MGCGASSKSEPSIAPVRNEFSEEAMPLYKLPADITITPPPEQSPNGSTIQQPSTSILHEPKTARPQTQYSKSRPTTRGVSRAGFASSIEGLPKGTERTFRQILRELESTTKFTKDELFDLAQLFTEVSQDASLQGRELVQEYMSRCKLEPQLTQLVIGSMKEDGKMAMQECILALSALQRGDTKDKMRYLLSLFVDAEKGKDGPNQHEMLGVIEVLFETDPTMQQLKKDAAIPLVIPDLVQELFREVDDDMNGFLSVQEFMSHSDYIVRRLLGL